MKPDPRIWEERAKQVMAQGCTGTNSKRTSAYIDGAYPTHVKRGSGCYVWDWQGKKYLDMIGGLGTNLFGYRHPKVTEATIKAINQGGPCFSLPHTLEVEVAELIKDVFPAAERVRFLKTGSEAATASIRIARASSGALHVFSEGYHGWHDEFTGLTPPAIGAIKSEYMHPHDREYAEGKLSIIEPIQTDAGDERRKYVNSLMKNKGGIIFDEVITGGRVPKHSVARWWGLEPDIICLGKGIANGYPLAIVAGKKEVMNSSEYFVSSTYSGDTVALAACKAVLEMLQRTDPNDLWFYANRFQDKVNEVLKTLDLHLSGYGTRAMFPTTEPNAPEFMQEAMDQGILIGKAWFYGYAHMESVHEDSVISVLGDVAKKVKAGKVTLRGKPPIETFKR